MYLEALAGPHHMELHIPQELQEHPELVQKVLDKLPAYLQLDEPGAKLEVTRAGEDGDHVRLYPGTIDYDRAQRG